MLIHKIVSGETDQDIAHINRIAAMARLQPYPPEMAEEILTNSCLFSYLIQVPSICRGPVGYIVFQVIPPEGEILDLAVVPFLHRRQFGTELMRKAWQVFGAYGVETCFLEVRESNWPALRFYQKHGFVVRGSRSDYYTTPTESALLLARDIGSIEPVPFLA